MTPEQATDLAQRTVAAINTYIPYTGHPEPHRAADRERVASDLAGFMSADYAADAGMSYVWALHATRYAIGLRRTAALYGVTP